MLHESLFRQTVRRICQWIHEIGNNDEQKINNSSSNTNTPFAFCEDNMNGNSYVYIQVFFLLIFLLLYLLLQYRRCCFLHLILNFSTFLKYSVQSEEAMCRRNHHRTNRYVYKKIIIKTDRKQNERENGSERAKATEWQIMCI